MGTVFQGLGIVFVILVVVVALAFLLIRRKLKALAKALSGYAASPSEIHLEEEMSPSWIAEPRVQTMMKELTGLGFTRGRAYSVQEMPQVELCSFFRTNPTIACALYQHEAMGNWVDLVVKYEDETSITVTNAPTGEDVDTRPGSTKVFLKDTGPTELCRELEGMLEHKATRSVDDANFKQVFEEAYKEDMEWRNKRGGVTEEEVRRIARKQGQDVGESGIAEAMRQIKVGELYQLHKECIDNFTRQVRISAETDGHDTDSLFVVSDQLDAGSYVDYLSGYLDFSDDQVEQLERLSKVTRSSRVLFMKGNGSLPRRSRALKIGSVNSPIDADIYRAPSEV